MAVQLKLMKRNGTYLLGYRCTLEEAEEGGVEGLVGFGVVGLGGDITGLRVAYMTKVVVAYTCGLELGVA